MDLFIVQTVYELLVIFLSYKMFVFQYVINNQEIPIFYQLWKTLKTPENQL
jgi:hypothetical protein